MTLTRIENCELRIENWLSPAAFLSCFSILNSQFSIRLMRSKTE